MATRDDDDVARLIPGRDPDPGARVEVRVRIAWALVGVFFTLGVFAYLLQQLGLIILPPPPRTLVDFARLTAFGIACVNLGIWMWFPLEDLGVLRRWVRTSRKIFPMNVAEFYAILVATVLLIALILGTLRGAIWFGVAGAGVYLWNLLGFAYIRREIAEAIGDARVLFARQSQPTGDILLRALRAVERHWSCDDLRLLRGRQQTRHAALTLSFACVVIVALIGGTSQAWTATAYLLGAVAIVAGEVSIAVWRTQRDAELLSAEEDLRAAAHGVEPNG